MKLDRIILWTLGLLIVCSMASATLDATVHTLCEKNISIDLGPNFRLTPSEDPSGSDGVFTESVVITGTGSKGIATLEIIDIYDEMMKSLGTEGLSQIVMGAVSFGTSYSSDLETGNFTGYWSAVSSKGENVTVNTMDTRGTSLSIYGKEVDIAFWNLEDGIYGSVISAFDKNTTSKIINTLEIN